MDLKVSMGPALMLLKGIHFHKGFSCLTPVFGAGMKNKNHWKSISPPILQSFAIAVIMRSNRTIEKRMGP